MFLYRRFTRARLGEVLSLNDVKDIDYGAGDVKLVARKRHAKTDHVGRKVKYRQLVVWAWIGATTACSPCTKTGRGGGSGDGGVPHKISRLCGG